MEVKGERGQLCPSPSLCNPSLGSLLTNKPYKKVVGGAVTSWLVRSTPKRAVRVRALAGDIVL